MKKIIGSLMAAALMLAGAGCGMLTDGQKQELDAAIRTAIIKAIDEKGQKAAEDLVDKLVEEGKLSESTAAQIKKVIPAGIEKVKKTLEEIKK
ncbi:MAG: hypothetical protein J6A21_09750 [Lentisphaeria bacterium]|nr:hypothetical protein [Lentisphaeria bacterium]